MNHGNIKMNYTNQGYAGRMGNPAMMQAQGRGQFGGFSNGYTNGLPGAGRHQFMNHGYGRQMMRPGMNMGQNMQGQMGQRGMNMMPNMQRQMNPMGQMPQMNQMPQQGMNMMPNMQGQMNPMGQMPQMNQMPQQGMNMMPNMQGQMNQANPMGQMPQPNMNPIPQVNHSSQPTPTQSIDGVTFEPYNPTAHQPQAAIPNITPPTTRNDENPSSATQPQFIENESARILSNFIQGEKNAQSFYSELAELAGSKQAQRVIAQILDNTDRRRKFFGALYNRISGGAYSEKDLPVIKSHNFSHGVRMAIEIETGTIREMADLYEKFDNGASQRTFNSLIQKKMADVISLQMLLV